MAVDVDVDGEVDLSERPVSELKGSDLEFLNLRVLDGELSEVGCFAQTARFTVIFFESRAQTPLLFCDLDRCTKAGART